MHVLTKIFIVIVALLAVMLVPLVVVYAKNETTYKTRYATAEAARAAAVASSTSAQTNFGAETERLRGEIKRLSEMLAERSGDVTEKDVQLAQVEADLTTSQAQFSQLGAELRQLVTTNQAAQNLVDQLVAEAGELRSQTLQSARENAELVTRVREMDRELSVANAAVRSLREEVQRLGEANTRNMETIQIYASRHGALEGDRETNVAAIDVSIVANVINVTQDQAGGRVLAEIDAGQRDGIKMGWELVLADERGAYLGTLRIIQVDVNRSVGVAETPSGESVSVAVGAQAHAIPD